MRADRQSSRWYRSYFPSFSLPSSSVLPQQCSLEVRLIIISKEAGLGFEEKDIQLLVPLAFVSVFERTWIVCGGFAGAVAPQSGQRYNMVREAMQVYIFLLSGILFAGEERGACAFLIRLFLDKDGLWDCRIACRRRLLRTVCYFLIPWDRFPSNSQLRPRMLIRNIYLDPLVLEVTADYSWYLILLDRRPYRLE